MKMANKPAPETTWGANEEVKAAWHDAHAEPTRKATERKNKAAEKEAEKDA
jgi:hypothetical protein